MNCVEMLLLSVGGIIIISCIFILFLTDYLYIHSEKDLNKIDYLKSSWEKSIILDIQLSRIVCPIDYLPIRLFLTDEAKNTTALSDLENYTNYTLSDNYDYYIFRNSLICVKRRQKNYLEYFPLGGGTNRDDFFGNSGDLTSEISLTEVFIINIEEPTPDGYFRRDFYDNKKSLIFKLDRGAPIVDFRLEIGEICSHPLEHNLSESLMNYKNFNKFNNCKTKIGGINRNPHYTWIDNDKISNVFSESIIPSDFKNPDTLDANLYYQRYPSVNNTCISYLPTFIENFSNRLNSSYKMPLGYAKANMIIAWIILSGFVFFLFMFYVSTCSDWNEDSKECFIVLSVIIVVGVAITSVIITWIYFALFTDTIYTQSLSSYKRVTKYGIRNILNPDFLEKCFDYFTSEYLINVKDLFNQSYISVLMSSILITLISSITIILPIIGPMFEDMYDH